VGYRLLADLLVLLHLTFVLFVVLGGLLVLRHPRFAWLHLPAAAWGAFIEAVGWICPLTPLENILRRHAGDAGYAGGFIEHYLLRLLYPEGLTRKTQFVLAGIVLAINLLAYGILLRRQVLASNAALSRRTGELER
jgi:uncharacterized protein DUF2784